MNTKPDIRKDVLMLTTMGLLIALSIVFRGWLSIMITPQFRLSFDFLPIALIAMKYGPLHAGTAAMMADLIGFWIMPRGAFFPGFTLTAFMMGATYGIFLNKSATRFSLVNISVAAVVVVVFIQWGLETLWLTFIMESPYFVLLAGRIVRTVIMLPLQIITIKMVAELAKRAKLL
ncbi:MAG: folate family ECF transporter S component [Defluviitaleaceae bacterium]|nr:folate family ECF transporter S component [Defluviitaleaceae bacterium]